MIWQNPWAFAGLITVAIPVLVHLLSRRNARVERFPSLRFLPVSLLTPVRRTRITDPLLMLLRALIVAVAVGALAQPLFRSDARTATAARRVVRAIVVDTSASMLRQTATGTTAVDSARRLAASLAESSVLNVVLESDEPAAVIRGAASWLSTQNGRRELIVISDFQVATIDSIDLAPARDDAMLRLEQIAVNGAVPFTLPTSRSGDGILQLTAPSSTAAASAALRAAAPLPFDTSAFAIAIVYPDAPGRPALAVEVTEVTDAAYAAAVLRTGRDAILQSALDIAETTRVGSAASRTTVIGGTAGKATIEAGQADLNGKPTLVFLPSFSPDQVASAALISAAARAALNPPSPAERDPATIPAEVLRRWEHTTLPEQVVTAGAPGESDGRWFWLAVLALIAVETIARRRPADRAAPESSNAR